LDFPVLQQREAVLGFYCRSWTCALQRDDDAAFFFADDAEFFFFDDDAGFF
jgi:hypothetical protein